MEGRKQGRSSYCGRAAVLVSFTVMPRTARIAPGGLVYHVLNRSAGKMHMFRKEDDFEAFQRVTNGQCMQNRVDSRHKVSELAIAADVVGVVPRLLGVREDPARGVTTYTWRFDPPPTLFGFEPLEEQGPLSFSVAEPEIEDVPYRDLDEMRALARRWREVRRGQWFTVPKLSGFCLLVKREVYEVIGGLDEQFGLGFFDDDDLAIRARQAGFELAVAHDLFIHHFGGRTLAGNRVERAKAVQRKRTALRGQVGAACTAWAASGASAVPRA